jgi:hypothetical protein
MSVYQPGGTLTAIASETTGYTKDKITDPTTLGRCSGHTLSTSLGHNLNIIMAYQATKSDRLHTNYQQQLAYYHKKQIKKPDPRKLMLVDLAKISTTVQ